MARGMKKSHDEQIASLDEQMEKVQQKMDRLMEAKEELMKAKKEAEISQLYQFIQSKGMSAEQFIEFAEGSI